MTSDASVTTAAPALPGEEDASGRWDAVRDGDHDDLRSAVRASRPALVRLGGAFMTSEDIVAAARPLALSPLGLYFQGRSGALGHLTTASVTRLFGMFPARAVDSAMGGREPLVPPSTAATAFARAAAAWGTRHLGDLPDDDLLRLSSLAEAVVDRTPTDALPLAAAWAQQPRPEEPAARAAHAAFLLRELRGALHFAALALHGLPVAQAVLAEPDAGPSRLRFFGWRDAEVAELEAAMDDDDRRGRWTAAESDTDDALTARVLAALGEDDAHELAALLRRARSAAWPGF